MRYAIFEGNLERLRKKMTRIRNKCAKYGCDFRYEEVGEEYREVTDDNGNTVNARFILVEAEGHSVINGWRFVASLDHTEKGNIISRATDIEVPERYYCGDPKCEHCGNKRVRHTYIVRNDETGEFKQVGRNCLCDYTHGMSAEGVAMYMNGIDELISGEATVGCSITRYYGTKEYLRYVAETIRHFGYVKSGSWTRATADRAESYYGVDHGWRFYGDLREEYKNEMAECGFNAESDEAVKTVEDAIAWLNEQPENNNYMHNLKTAVSLEMISAGHFGILASLFPTYDRELEREATRRKEAEKGALSNWVGEVGKRVAFDISETRLITSWETMYGTTYVWKILDKDGNVFTWKTSRGIPDSGKMVGTVKEHKEFRGVKQTELTRCRIA